MEFLDLVPLSGSSILGGKQKTSEVLTWTREYHGLARGNFDDAHKDLEDFKGSWAQSTYRGTVYFGFTSFCNQRVVAFHPPSAREVHGHSIRWDVVHIHECASKHASKQIVCMHYDSHSLQKTWVDKDMFGLYGILILYRNNASVWNETRGKGAVESVDNARRMLVNMQLGILPSFCPARFDIED